MTLGTITVVSWVYNLLCFLGRTCCGTKATTDRYGKDSWAVITGAAEGIGNATAKELARRGFNIVLMDKDEKKLRECEETIKKIRSSCKTKVIKIDFSIAFTAELLKKTWDDSKLDDLDISILVNSIEACHINKFSQLTA